MKTNKIVLLNHVWYMSLCAICAICAISCTKKRTYTYCDDYTNKDSLIQCILINYDVEAYYALACCFCDSNIDLYGFLIADSSGICGSYKPTYLPNGESRYGLSDTVTLFYESKGVAMGSYTCFDTEGRHKIDFPDSIYDILYGAFHRYGVSVWDKDKYRIEYSNKDSLINVTLANTDVDSYNKLRLLVSTDSLLPVAIEMANKTHYPIACYDVYYSSVCGTRLSKEKFDFAYSYLNEAAGSMYYPAVYLKACLCLTGAYFPPDTILGKELLERCHGRTSLPFWQQYYKPVVYIHLLPSIK